MNQYLKRAVKTVDFWIEWFSTVVLIFGVCLTSWDITPYNLWVSLFANSLWIYLGARWKRWSLVIISVVICGIFTAGLIRFYTI